MIPQNIHYWRVWIQKQLSQSQNSKIEIFSLTDFCLHLLQEKCIGIWTVWILYMQSLIVLILPRKCKKCRTGTDYLLTLFQVRTHLDAISRLNVSNMTRIHDWTLHTTQNPNFFPIFLGRWGKNSSRLCFSFYVSLTQTLRYSGGSL